MNKSIKPVYYDGGNERIIVEFPSIEQAGLYPETPLKKINELSDGYHTYDELYEFRKMYNAALFNEWASRWKNLQQHKDSANLEMRNAAIMATSKYNVHKSWKHNDGELCFGGGWFIVSAMLPTGLISNHYKAEDWDLFKVPEVKKALYEFDGHTPQDVLVRLKNLI